MQLSACTAVPAAPFIRLSREAKTTIVASGQNLRIRIAIVTISLFDKANKRFALIRFSIELPQGTLVYHFIHKDMSSNEYPSHYFNRCSRKGDMLLKLTTRELSKLLHELSSVTVTGWLK